MSEMVTCGTWNQRINTKLYIIYNLLQRVSFAMHFNTFYQLFLKIQVYTATCLFLLRISEKYLRELNTLPLL